MIDTLRRGLQPLFQRVPRLRPLALAALDIAVRPLLLPFRLSRPPGDEGRAAAVANQVDAFNQAADIYYANHAGARALLDKPFSEPAALARRLIDAGVLIEVLRLEPGDVVLDLGAGACWFSHLLNRFGCPTVAVDVSPTALALGRQRFEQDPKTNWALHPQFLPYDGRLIPAADGTIDRIVLVDAYHHLPNPVPLLREMRRVLKADGVVAMSEPGRGHAASAPSVAEAEATGVLENELVLEDIAERALESGFTAARVVLSAGAPFVEIDASQLRPFMGGRGFSHYWKNLCAALDSHHYILLFAGEPEPTTKRPKQLRAMIRQTGGRLPGKIVLDIRNAGDTRWVAAENAPGWTRVGAHLYGAGSPRTLIDFDWLRIALPCDVAPDERIEVSSTLPAIDRPGDYVIVFDLVIEGVDWFANRGSPTFQVPYSVR